MDFDRVQKLLKTVKTSRKLLADKIKDKECLRYLLKNGYVSKSVDSKEVVSGNDKAPAYAKKFKFLHKRYGLTVDKSNNDYIKITRRGELKLRFKDKDPEPDEPKTPQPKEDEDEREG